MKKIKKLVAIALAAVMVLAMGSMAMAATTSSDDTGSITINGLTGGVTVNAYQIAKATYDSDGNFLGYEMTVSTDGTTWSIGSDGSWENMTEADLAALYAAIEVAGTQASGTAQVSMGSDSATITGLGVGSYLIVVSNSESVAYGMMIGSVSYDTEGVSNGEFNVSDCELWAKATTPTVEKTEKGGSANDDTHGESANAGDEITFDITVNNIPSYQGEYPVFDVDDTLTGLTISEEELNALTVKIVDANGDTVAILIKGSDYTVTQISDTEFDVNFVVNGSYMLNGYAGKGYTIVIEYAATVVDSEAYANGEAEHENDAVLNYATTSYVNHDNGNNTGKDEDNDYEYTFALNATKTDNATNAQPLAGATFALYTNSTCSTAYTQDGSAVTATSTDDGTIAFSGLEEGTYYMKETEAPSGYLLNQAVYKIDITANYDESGKIATWSIEITLDGEEVASATQSADTGLTIINTKTGLLPSMGGRGTLIFTIIGCAIVACAVVGVTVTRRRRAA